MKLFKNIRAFFRAVVFDFRLSHCRREANRLRALTGQKHLVIVLNRRPVVISKQNVKNLVRDGFYRKGVTPADIESRAIYRTL